MLKLPSFNLQTLVPFVELLSKALSFISVIIITRLVSVEEFGAYYYIISIVAWASVFMDGGISFFIINKSVKGDIGNLGEYLLSRVVFSLLTILILCIGVGVFKQDYVIYIILYSFSFLFILLTAFFKIVARTQGEVKLDITTILLEPLIRICILLFFFYFLESILLSTVFIILLLTAFSGFILSFLYFKQKIPIKISRAISLRKMLNILKETKNYLMMYLFMVGFKRIEIILADYKFDEYSVGLYSSADNFYNSAYLFFTSLILVGLKSHYKFNSKQKFINVLKLFGLSILCVIFLMTFASTIYSVFYTSEYEEGYKILRIMSLSLLFTPISYFFMLNNNFYSKTAVNIKVFGSTFFVKLLLLFLAKDMDVFVYSVVSMDLVLCIVYLTLNLKKLKNI